MWREANHQQTLDQLVELDVEGRRFCNLEEPSIIGHELLLCLYGRNVCLTRVSQGDRSLIQMEARTSRDSQPTMTAKNWGIRYQNLHWPLGRGVQEDGVSAPLRSQFGPCKHGKR